MSLGTELAHVRIPAESVLASLLGGLQHGSGVGVLEQHVSALVQQALGAFGFLGRIKPAVHPDDLGLDLGVHALGTQGEGVDVADHLRNWDRADDTQGAGLAHRTCDHAGHVGTFKGTAVVHAHVFGRLVTGGVFELHVLVVGGNLEHGLHVAKRRGEDDLVALSDQIANHAFCVRAFRHFFDERGLDLVAQLGFQGLATIVVSKRPASIADGADIDEGDLQRVSLDGRSRCGLGGSSRSGFFLLPTTSQGSSRGQTGPTGQLQQRAFGHCLSHVISRVEQSKSVRTENTQPGAMMPFQAPGWKGLPSEAGMLTRIHAGLREIRTSTTMVAT